PLQWPLSRQCPRQTHRLLISLLLFALKAPLPSLLWASPKRAWSVQGPDCCTALPDRIKPCISVEYFVLSQN
ncbi:hypothetical protein EDB87DRAFT_1831423, partial [Lactarius vividus]